MSVTSPTPARRRVAALLAGSVLAAAASLLTAPSALAHDSITGSTPKDGSTVTVAPTEVRMTFTDEVKDFGAAVVVKAPDGTKVTDGKPVIDGVAVTQALTAITVPGLYTVAYRVVSSDGHPISGKLSFTVDLPTPSPSATPTVTASASPTASPSESPSAAPSTASPAVSPVASSGAEGSSSSLPWILGGVALVVAAVGAVIALRRRSA